MKNKKGFTLIELLAVIVILGIVVAIAIPGINSVISTARANTFAQEAVLLADGARMQLIGERLSPLPTASTSVCIPVSMIDVDKGGTSSAYGRKWVSANSFIEASLVDNNYVFKIALRDEGNNGFTLTQLEEIDKSKVLNNLSSGSTIPSGCTTATKVD